MADTERHRKFDTWAALAEARGFSGPVRVGGFNNFQFLHPDGAVAAVWHGAEGFGTIFREPVALPAAVMEPISTAAGDTVATPAPAAETVPVAEESVSG